MNAVTILLFFLYTWGTGFTATFFLKNSDNFLERNLMRIGIGLGILPILIYLLSLLHVPIDWRIYSAITLFLPGILIIRHKVSFDAKSLGLTKSNLYILVVLGLFTFSFFMMAKGAFIYPWLEDGDPWDYAVAAKYISVFKTTSPPDNMADYYKQEVLDYKRLISNYMEPYPQGYPILMGLLYQTNSSVSWTLKFFNALIISLAIIFFYFFAKEFMGNGNKALFAAFLLTAIPCFVSHFIYSQALAATLFFPAFYALERIKHDRNWMFLAAPIIASILMTQSSSAGTFGALFFPVYWLGKAVVNRNFMKWVFLAGILGLGLSFIFWGAMIHKYTWQGTNPLKGNEGSVFASGNPAETYTWADFYSARTANKIDNPIGLGPVIFGLIVIGLIVAIINYKAVIKTEWMVIALIWLAINFINIHGNRLPVQINPHRGWSFFAIAAAIVATYGIWQLIGMFKMNPAAKAGIVISAIILVSITSAYPKYVVNTSFWPTHYFASPTDIEGYMWLENLPDGTMVTSLCRNDEKVIGMDMHSTKMWDMEQRDFQRTVLNNSITHIQEFLRGKGYDYMILDSSCVEFFGLNRTNTALSEMVSSESLRLAYPFQQDQQGTTFIFQLA